MHGSPSEANDVLVSEAKGITEENCSRTVEIGYEAFRFSVEGLNLKMDYQLGKH